MRKRVVNRKKSTFLKLAQKKEFFMNFRNLSYAAVLLPLLASGQNLIWNSGFELGMGNWDFWQLPSSKKLIPFTPAIQATTENPAEGRMCAKIMSLPGWELERPLLFSHSFALEPDTDYIVSCDLRSDVPGAYIRLSVSNDQRPLTPDHNGKLPPFNLKTVKMQKNQSFSMPTISLGKEWKNYSFSFKTAPATRSGTFKLEYNGSQNIKRTIFWIMSELKRKRR